MGCTMTIALESGNGASMASRLVTRPDNRSTPAVAALTTACTACVDSLLSASTPLA
jgi:Ni,Fe-hydrogenase I small subunit